MAAFPQRVTLGRSGLSVSKLGLGSSFNAPTHAYREAFDRGVNYFYWGSIRREAMGQAFREIARDRRDDVVLVLQSYSRSALLLPPFFERGLRKLATDYADVLLLGWHNHRLPQRILDAALELREKGRVRHLAVSTHNRSFLPSVVDDEEIAIWHTRYNAAHRGAENEVFPCLDGRDATQRPGVVTYTTTRWGSLPDASKTPAGERTPTGTDCYRFALSCPEVDLCLAGPNDESEMKQALDALELGPMDPEEIAWMRRVGDGIFAADRRARALD